MNWGGLRPLYYNNWLMSWQNKNLLKENVLVDYHLLLYCTRQQGRVKAAPNPPVGGGGGAANMGAPFFTFLQLL